MTFGALVWIVTADLRRRAFIYLAFCIVAIALAAVFDRATAQAIRDCGLEQFIRDHATLKATLKAPGTYWFTLCVAAVVVVMHRAHWRAAIFLLAATIVTAVGEVVKWLVGRYRPFKLPDGSGRLAPFEFHPFPGEAKNLSFPSGHAFLAFATAAALGMLWPRWRWAFYLGAAVVAFERVAEDAHWLSDATAAAVLGVGGACLIRRLIGDKLDLDEFSLARSSVREGRAPAEP